MRAYIYVVTCARLVDSRGASEDGRGGKLVREERGYSNLTPDIREHDGDRRRRRIFTFFFSFSFISFCFSISIPLDSPARVLPMFSG